MHEMEWYVSVSFLVGVNSWPMGSSAGLRILGWEKDDDAVDELDAVTLGTG